MIPPTDFQPIAHLSNIPRPFHGIVAGISSPQIGWTSLSSRMLPPLPPSRATARSRCNQSTLSGKPKRDPSHIPRPPNSFMLFRRDFVANRPAGYNVSETKSLSKQAGDAWRVLPSSEKKKWAKRAHDVAADHARRNPEWKYKPSRKSDKLRVEPQQQSSPSQSDQLTMESIPNSAPAALLQASLPPPDLMRRRESLRLSNWDDSVISPTPHLAVYPNERLEQLPESLHRRSSSVPIPETFYMLQGSSSFQNQEQVRPFSPLNHRLSYSGIRPGFIPMDIFDSNQYGSAECNTSEDLPLQPLSSLRDDPPPSFEGYTIRVDPSIAPRQQQYVSPLAQDTMSMADFSLFDNHSGFNNAILSQDTSGGFSPQAIPLGLGVPSSPIMTDTMRGATSPPEPLISLRAASPLMDSLQGVSDVSPVFPDNLHQIESGAPVEQPARPLSPPAEAFSFDLASLDALQQYVHDLEGLQLSGLGFFNEGQAIVDSSDKQLERRFSLGLNLSEYTLPEFDVFNEFVEVPYSVESSNSGSGVGSSPSGQSQLDFEAAFSQ